LYLLRPSADAFAVFYALLRLGAVPAFIDPRMELSHLLACVAAVRARILLAIPAVHGLARLARRAFASTEVRIGPGPVWMWGGHALQSCLGEKGDVPHPPVTPSTECYLPFTSGSTGLPKGVYCTHEMVRAQAALVREVCGWREGTQVVMCYAPFVPFALADGLTVILPRMDFSRPAAADPRRIAEAVTVHQAPYAFASPIVWQNLARCGERTGVRLQTLQHAIAAGAPVPARLHRRLAGMMHSEGRLHTPYGATEAMPLTTTDTWALAETWEASRQGYGTCIGRPLSGIELQIIQVTDAPIAAWSDHLPVEQGAIGEIVVAGDVVSPSYPDRPEETARAKIRCGARVLHRTGDLGRMDSTGRVWFCGRKAHRIETGDGMLAPVTLENIFNEHPAVFRSALIGVGPAGAQIPVGCLELEAGHAFSPRLEAELHALAEGTPFRGVVTRFLPCRGFPVDARHNSKIRREELAGWAARRLDRHASST
jgi:acyl-CoA synthetase (AMP-forming)/AMP-acid ligase II